MRQPGRLPLLLSAAAFAGLLLSSPALGAEKKGRGCCRIIKIDTERGVGILRNPASGKAGQFTLRPGDAERFKVGDTFDPVKGELNGKKIGATYETVLPEIDHLPKAHLVRVRGHEVAVKADDKDVVYRFHTPKFDRVLSSMRPGDEMSVDEPGGWLYYRVKGYGKVPPAIWSYRIE